ncbi:hypothetical protein [Cohnella faecalis]|uniref:hypothetical protein n=1 Tax=Cohnella faecalis TaxID=2315694 RepID=UPI0013141684|nr:hypothetical protein [Cohnella faecalis]
MLMWDKPEVVEGLTVYRDHEDRTLYYVLPSVPGFESTITDCRCSNLSNTGFRSIGRTARRAAAS